MKIVSFLVADKIYKQPDSQKVNVEGVFDFISSESFPALHKKLFVLTIFEGENKKYNYELTIEYKSKTVAKSETIIDKKGGLSHYVISEFNNLPLIEPGEYIFKVKLDTKTAQKIILTKKI